MGKGKLAKFADMERFENVFQSPHPALSHEGSAICGRWRENYFKNTNPIVLELGCGKGEYTVGLARLYPDVNFIGVDIKGARMWTGAKQALEEGLKNVAFLRTDIAFIDRFFAPDEVQELWLTFSDPQMKNPRKRLTSTYFLMRYRRFLVDRGVIHLKTDSRFLFTYTRLMAEHNGLPVALSTEDLYNDPALCEEQGLNFLSIRTYYEQMWLDRGLPIRYLRFRLPHKGELLEPDVEIPFDEYRSYRRDKRTPKEKGM
ncbi:MAG: tRNA (guanosine(46)-N7)-methyltransferase TrmB [Prevotella sp.]|nr:tRNA (guanosine(46)-N7)-methyltransferase TrmB [Prevotella sp.]